MVSTTVQEIFGNRHHTKTVTSRSGRCFERAVGLQTISLPVVLHHVFVEKRPYSSPLPLTPKQGKMTTLSRSETEELEWIGETPFTASKHWSKEGRK